MEAPYPKPVIHNHDTDTEATGRVYSASFSEYTSAGRPGIIVTPKITQEKAIKDILEGRLLTVSIGASTNAAVCSICGTDIINEGFCGHMRGEEYDGQVAEWVAGDLFFDELSWVNVPADSDAMITSNGLNAGMMSTGEAKSDYDGPRIVTGTIEAKMIKVSSKPLTSEEGVVTSVSESTEKEESIVAGDTIVTTTTESEEQPVVEEKDEATQQESTNQETAEEVDAKTVEESTTEVEEDTTNLTNEVVETPESNNTEQESETADLQEVQEALVDAQATIEELTNANEQLAKELQESAVNFLVDLRMAIGKESDRDGAVAKYATRTIESIKDSISDILVEKPTLKTTTRTVEHIEKPTGEVVTESKTLATDQVKVISNEDALKSLFSGRI